MAWTIRNYNAFLKSAKKEGLTHRKAQQTYRSMSGRIGRSLKGVDVLRHPRIFQQEGRKSLKPPMIPGPMIPGEFSAGGGESGRFFSGSGVERYLKNFDVDDYPYDEYDSSADYGIG